MALRSAAGLLENKGLTGHSTGSATAWSTESERFAAPFPNGCADLRDICVSAQAGFVARTFVPAKVPAKLHFTNTSEKTGERHQKGGSRLFGRPRHLDHSEMAESHLWLRGGDVYRRSRPGRGAGTGAQDRRTCRHQGNLYRRSARRIRQRFRLSDDARQCPLRGRLPARHVDCAAADFQAPDRNRP